ncbi:MAG: twin-arginine translocase TatA/TatE family subunit [Thermoprotei archaeon]
MIGSITDWVILLVVALVLFGGSKKIPELARGLGRAMGEFRRGQVEVEREIKAMGEAGGVQKSPVDATSNNAGSEQRVTAAVNDERLPNSSQGADQSSIEARIEQLERELKELKKARAQSST